MARTFNGTDEKITHAGTTLTSGQHFTMSFKFRTSGTGTYSLWGVRQGDPTQTGKMTGLRMASGNLRLEHDFLADTTNNVAVSSAGYNDDNWYTFVGVYDNATLQIYVGGSADGNSGSIPNLVLNSTNGWAMATRSDFSAEWFPGELAELAFWKGISMNASQVAVVAKYSPLFFPDGLTMYFPLLGRTSPEIELIGGDNGTLVSAPANFVHPAVIYPDTTQMGKPSAAVTTRYNIMNTVGM